MDFYDKIDKDLVYWVADNVPDIPNFLNSALRAVKENRITYSNGQIEPVKVNTSDVEEQNDALLKALDYYRYNIQHIDKASDPHLVLGSCIILLSQLTEEYQELVGKLDALGDPEVYNEVLEKLVASI